MLNNQITPLPYPKPYIKRKHGPPKAYRTHVWYRRHHKHIYQQDLARLVGISRRSLHYIESGKSVPSVVIALRIARILEMPVEDLFKDRL